jgi:imidazolonepropionase-like amidohydrolase
VLVRDGIVAEVAKGTINAPKARTIDLGGRTLMPGLIDCHVHILAPGRGSRSSAYPDRMPSYLNIHAGKVLRELLMRGFTTVRDAAGADLGHKQAVEEGLVVGPRLFVSGRALTQTGGHGDNRSRGDLIDPCGCVHLRGGGSRIADGVDEVRRAVRDEIRLGAQQVKVMAGGGVVSEADPIDQLQYSMDELKAIVDEAKRSHTYVLAHAYTAEAIQRCIESGIRTIEHGNFLDDDAAKMMARHNVYLVPTLVTYRVLAEKGPSIRLSPSQMEKVADILKSGTRSLEVAHRHGVKMAFGTDLITPKTDDQPREFLIRAEVMKPADVIRSATVISAEVVRMPGKLGVIAPGALADLLAVDGDPLADLGLLQDEGKHLAMIMKGGALYKDRISA